MNIVEALNVFKSTLKERGYPPDIIWIQGSQIILTKDLLYIYVLNGFPYERHVVKTFEAFQDDLECGAALMLAAADENTSYCTLLLDSFGSDGDIEYENDFFYLWCNPYINRFTKVASRWAWFKLKHLGDNRIPSSLDYAFVLSSENT